MDPSGSISFYIKTEMVGVHNVIGVHWDCLAEPARHVDGLRGLVFSLEAVTFAPTRKETLIDPLGKVARFVPF
jgi:hypothetical protein